MAQSSPELLTKITQPQLPQNMAQPQLQPNPQLTRVQQPANDNLTLRGANGRLASGICLIVSGVAEIIIAGFLITRRFNVWEYSCQYPDRVAWGIWGGLFAVITGCLGAFSRRSKCMVIAFLVLGIIEAVIISPPGTIIYIYQTACASEEQEVLPFSQGRLELALYTSMLIMCAFQFLMAIIGASFTCIAICSSRDPMAQQLIVNNYSVTPHQTTGVQANYGAVTSTNGQQRLDNSYWQPIPPTSNQIATTQHQPIMK